MTDKEIDKKLKKMEEQLDVITSSLASGTPNSSFSHSGSRFPPLDSRFPAAGRSDEIDLRELFSILWQGKWWIVGMTFLFAVAGVVYALSLPNMYKSEGIYAPAQKEGAGGGMAGQLGGLASLAGVSLGGGESNDIDQAMALIASWPFLEKVIDKHDLKPLIMGVKGWNRETGAVVWDDEVYNPINKKWLRGALNGRLAEPSSYEVYEKFSQMVTVKFDKKTAMLNVAFEYYSPVIARDWVVIIIEEINEAFRSRDMAESVKNVEYLKGKIQETSITEMQAVFYSMIETQMKTLMLAEVDEEYLVKKIVEPKIAEIKSQPKRAILVVLFCFFGLSIGVFCVFIRFFAKR